MNSRQSLNISIVPAGVELTAPYAMQDSSPVLRYYTHDLASFGSQSI